MQEESEKNKARNLMFEILDTREKYSEISIGKLYRQDDMPSDLLIKHQNLDDYIESLYNSKGFKSSEELMLTLYNHYLERLNA